MSAATPVLKIMPNSPPTYSTSLPVVTGINVTSITDRVSTGLEAPARSRSSRDFSTAAKALQQTCGIPTGLARVMAKATASHPLRVMIVDNSGSMQSGDGQRLIKSGTRHRMLGCTRWLELKDDVLQIAALSESLGARTDFHMLNPRGGVDTLTIAANEYTTIKPLGPHATRSQLEEALKAGPGGTTPLTEAIMRVVAMLEQHAPVLRRMGETVTVIIATDGLPDNPSSFHAAMQQLQRLPVWLVVRLCTDDDKVVNYWNDLDEQLEAPVEVLDDLRSEAQEVTSNNAWLTYGPPLHAARLFGLPGKIYDAIDEMPLTPSMIKEFLEDLLGCTGLPEPECDLQAFLEELRQRLQELNPTLDPKSLEMRPWVDVRKVERACRRDGSGGCTLM